MLLLVFLVASVFADFQPTTTKSYDLEVPGSNPIRIIEGEPLWQTTAKSNFEHRAFNIDKNFEEKDNPLQKFLETYADVNKRNKINAKNEENKDEEDFSDDKAKSWDLMQYQKHKHPYEDKNGWVSLEPVPWSVSKISKWQSKYKSSTIRPWDDYDMEEPQSLRPSWNKPITNNYEPYYLESKPDLKPAYSKPSAVYSQKVHVDYSNKNQHKHDENCKHSQKFPFHKPQKPFHDNDEIITDGLPANFPQSYEANRRHGTDIHPDTHPFSGDGEWVLLSTTRGYKFPQQRQRSLKINPESMGAHHGVRLTVLPPLKNSKVNMTTSHGGLLQVESSFQTVEQSRKQFVKKQNKRKRQKPIKPTKQVAMPTVTTTTKRNSGPDSSAVLAAVGAGMIPATMAMLVPMALGGRRKRDIPLISSNPKSLKLAVPHDLN